MTLQKIRKMSLPMYNNLGEDTSLVNSPEFYHKLYLSHSE